MEKEKNFKKFIADKFKIEKHENFFAYNVDAEEIIDICKNLYFEQKLQLKTITATDERKDGVGFKIYYVFGEPKENIFITPYIVLKNIEEFPSLTKDIHEASGYERRIKSFFGLEPVGHPNARGMLLHENWPSDIYPLRKNFDVKADVKWVKGNYEFQKVEGEGIYEIPVGPVHAGIIEPGHFRFSVAGEEILLLEPKLGYKHKGIEKLFESLPLNDKLKLSERVSGDTSFTHSLAFCQALENLAEIEVPKRAKYLRMIFSEMERLANHFNDIGFIMLDTGFSFGGSNCARLREQIMQWNERLSGGRYLRGVNALGGVNFDIDKVTAVELLKSLEAIVKDFNKVIEIARSSATLNNRLTGTGKLELQVAIDHGVIGVAGRASGIAHDARIEYPYAFYDDSKFEISLEKEGDVKARFEVRIKEVYTSFALIKKALENLPANKDLKSDKKIELRKKSYAIGITEGWRGEIVYFIITDANGDIARVDVRDPSFINWTVLGHAGKGNIVPDFPLINKSFDLSYSGNDL